MKRLVFLLVVFSAFAVSTTAVLGTLLYSSKADLAQSEARVVTLQTDISQLERDNIALKGLVISTMLQNESVVPTGYQSRINKPAIYAATTDPSAMQVVTDGERAAVRIRDFSTWMQENGKYEVAMTKTIKFPLEAPNQWYEFSGNSSADWPPLELSR